MFLACDEHLDLAIDEFTEKYQEPPDLYLVSQIKDRVLEEDSKCTFCDQKAVYAVIEYAD